MIVIQKLLRPILLLRDKLPVLYSVTLVILIPSAIIGITLWNLRAFERDMHFAVREEAITVSSFLENAIDSFDDVEALKDTLESSVENVSQLTHITLLEATEEATFEVVATTDTFMAGEAEMGFITNLAWLQKNSFFEQQSAPNSSSTVWTQTSPIYDDEDEAIGLLVLSVNTARVDSVIDRTTRDTLIVMLVVTLAVVLLLVNHLRFFQHSLLYEELQKLDEMKDDFISVASHELRTPITAIKGYVEMVERDLKGNLPEKTKKRMNIIKESIRRLDNLVEDLLNVSRLEGGRLNFEMQPLSPGEMVSSVIEQLLPTADIKDLALTFEQVEDQHINANPDRLREVLVNIIGNAIKYTPSGSVTVKQIVEDNKIKISVKDTGVGISPEDRHKLFKKFSRVQTKETREIPGTGLGLWITKEIIEHMDGDVFVDSIEGDGTVFTIVFPIVKGE